MRIVVCVEAKISPHILESSHVLEEAKNLGLLIPSMGLLQDCARNRVAQVARPDSPWTVVPLAYLLVSMELTDSVHTNSVSPQIF